MAELLQTLSTASFVLAVLLVAIALVFFIVFDIRAVVGELTGKTATSEIARLRSEGMSQKHKGRSLQSIIDSKSMDTTDFSLDKLNMPKTTTDEVSEFETVLLRETGISEEETSILSSAEQETSLLPREGVSEDETGLLGGGP